MSRSQWIISAARSTRIGQPVRRMSPAALLLPTPLAPVSLCAIVLFSSLVSVAILPAPAHAETLAEALDSAYRTNPVLDAERARLRATDEEVPAAKSGYRPTVSGGASIARETQRTKPTSIVDGANSPATLEVNVTQSLFDGFQTTNAVSEAEALVRAGRENLRNVESNVLFDAVTVYADVLRDQSIVALRDRNVSILSRELEAALARRVVREVTLTDVAQARARRARALSAADLAKANLRIARANYKRVIGHEPSKLKQPSLRTSNLPRSLAEALAIGEKESPNVVSALYREQASRFSVDRVRGRLLPRVDLEANYANEASPSILSDRRDSASITGRLTIPFYQGGEVYARVRQAKHTHVSRLTEIEQARNETQANITAAWSRLQAARAQLDSDQIQVDSAKTALVGVREEEKVGQRTLLDVLNAEQELLDAQVAQVVTRRDIIVASYALLSSIGRLSADARVFTDEIYDAEAHYDDVRNKWIGVTITNSGAEDVPADIAQADDVVDAVVGYQKSTRKRIVETSAIPKPVPAARFKAAAKKAAPRLRSRIEPDPVPRPILESLFKKTFE